jgi:CBS domain-containing protein
MKLQEIMVADVVQIAPDASIAAACKRMRDTAVGCLVVTSDSAIKGIVTARDLLGCIDQIHDPEQCRVAVHMSRPVTVLSPEEDPRTAADVMYNRRIKRLPLVKHGKLLGIISLADLASLAKRDLEQMQSSLLLASRFIRTQAGQGHRAGLRSSIQQSLSPSIEEQTVTATDTARSGEMASST